jgi:hypothetical protein
MSSDWKQWLFYVAAVYDGVLGLAFAFFWPQLFQLFEVTPPNHGGYVQFPALLLLVFGFMFLRIARDPERNRDLIVYGIGLKSAYSGLVFWYQLREGVPTMWVPWAWIDLVFLVLFVAAQRSMAQALPRQVRQ